MKNRRAMMDEAIVKMYEGKILEILNQEPLIEFVPRYKKGVLGWICRKCKIGEWEWKYETDCKSGDKVRFKVVNVPKVGD